jgi:hypothetical protein
MSAQPSRNTERDAACIDKMGRTSPFSRFMYKLETLSTSSQGVSTDRVRNAYIRQPHT